MQYSHNKCTSNTRRHNNTKVTGAYLNRYLHNHRCSDADPNHFNPRKQYNICYNLKTMIDRSPPSISDSPPPATNKNNTNNKVTPPSPPPPTPDRATRAFMRSRIPCDDEKLKGVKEIQVSVGEEKKTIDLTHLRASMTTKFNADVLSHYYKVPFGRLKMRQRRSRMADIAKVVLGACVDREAMRNDSEDYIKGNCELAIEICNLLDGVKDFLQKKMKVNFNHDVNDQPLRPVEDDGEGLIRELDEKNRLHRTALTLLGEVSDKGYRRMRKSMQQYVNLPDSRTVTKSRPTIIATDYWDTGPVQQPYDLEYIPGDPLFFDGNMEEEVALQHFSNHENSDIIGARIDGDYSDYVAMMKEKTVDQFGQEATEGELIVMDSIDGAEHLKSNKRVTSVISYSSMLYSSELIQSKQIRAGSSRNILTWQQVSAKETLDTLVPSLKKCLETKRVLRERNPSITFYDIHDGKMLYLLTGHAQWNRRNSPFLLCSCKKGEALNNLERHSCIKILHTEQVDLFERSRRRWEAKTSTSPSYDLKKHLDWVDERNKGVSHLGMHPEILPRENLRFDTFHLKCAITRKLMGWLRTFIMSQSTQVIEDCVKILRKIWNDFHIFVWMNKKNFSSFCGNELALFVSIERELHSYLQENLEMNDELEKFLNGYELWTKIFKFLGVTYIEEERDFEAEIEQFVLNVKGFYANGVGTYLAGAQGESFYSHCLRYYMPGIARETYARHALGPGIFTMQGFERRNKESKNAMKQYSNNRGNVLIQNMKRLWDIYKYDLK